MSDGTFNIEIDRPAEEVFAYVTDPARFVEWQDDVISVRMDGAVDGAPGVGTRFTTVRRIGRMRRAMTQEITRVEAPRHWAARGIAGPIRPSAEVTVQPLPAGRSRVTFALAFAGHGAGELIVPIVRRMAAKAAPRSYRRLKQRLEG